MLVANLNVQRIVETVADKGPTYHCPKCKDVVVLEKRRIITHHFPLKLPVICRWAKGETREQLKVKQLFKEVFFRRGLLRVEVEHEIPSLLGDRRADVVNWSPKVQRFALELQRTSIDYDSLENRTRNYIHSEVKVIWVPFKRPRFCNKAIKLEPNDAGEILIKKFSHVFWKNWMMDSTLEKFGCMIQFETPYGRRNSTSTRYLLRRIHGTSLMAT